MIAMRVATNVESYNAVLKKLKDLKWNYLCIPGIKAADTTMIGAWIKQYRNDEKKTFKVVLPHYAGDHEGIINFTTENITSSVTGKSILQRNTVRESQESLLDCLFPEAVPLCSERCFFGRSAG